MVEPRVERRLAAILAADVVGYSRLMEADEEGTLAALKACRSELIAPKIAEHRGRIVKTTGDGALVEFASVVDAVRCAIDVQDGMAARNAALPQDKRLDHRIGINLGDVLVEGDDLLGDGVNVAARLEALADPGGICLSEDAWRQVQGKIDAAAEDIGEQTLKNIARPVRVFRLSPAAGLVDVPGPVLALPDRPSIAVLPFQNMSDDPEQDYFADGMVEEIITGLSRLKWLFVIARNSSFTYKGRAVDVRRVGRELGVRYVLEGSVRKGGRRLRVTAQLIDAVVGTHLWADRYEGAIDDVFDLQDRITFDVVRAIEPSMQLAEVERARRKRPESLDAYDHFLRALPHAWAVNPADARKALEHLEAALAIDPDYAAAQAHAAWCHMTRHREMRDPRDLETAVRYARAALSRSIDDASALALAGFIVALVDRDLASAQAALDRALAINPHSAIALGFCALVCAFTGRHDAAIDFAERASRCNPIDPQRFRPDLARGMAYLNTGRYAEAIGTLQHATEAAPRFGIPWMYLAAAYASVDRMDEARAAIRRLLEVEPNFRIKNLDDVVVGTRDETMALKAALRKAGLPE
ncbi:MAG: tetratricopeptide repeat protein [Candidatus Eiseniibacteriota bacterium]